MSRRLSEVSQAVLAWALTDPGTLARYRQMIEVVPGWAARNVRDRALADRRGAGGRAREVRDAIRAGGNALELVAASGFGQDGVQLALWAEDPDYLEDGRFETEKRQEGQLFAHADDGCVDGLGDDR